MMYSVHLFSVQVVFALSHQNRWALNQLNLPVTPLLYDLSRLEVVSRPYTRSPKANANLTASRQLGYPFQGHPVYISHIAVAFMHGGFP